jgi:hypothetical protein
MVEIALAIVGFVVLLHASPIPLPARFKPVSCGFCLSVWLAVLCALVHANIQHRFELNDVVVPCLTALFAGLVSTLTPLFRVEDAFTALERKADWLKPGELTTLYGQPTSPRQLEIDYLPQDLP